jgi:hypothetical protein
MCASSERITAFPSVTTCALPDQLFNALRSFHVAVKPPFRTSDCCRLTRHGLLDERIVANTLIETLIPPVCACVTQQFRAPQNAAAARFFNDLQTRVQQIEDCPPYSKGLVSTSLLLCSGSDRS